MSQQINNQQPTVEPTAGEQILQSLSDAGEFIVETATSAKDAVVNKINEASEFIQANVAEAAYDFHAAEASDPNTPPGHRIVAKARMEADAMEVAQHKEGQEFHKKMADNRAQLASVEMQQGMNSVGDAASKTGQTISQTASDATAAAGETLTNAKNAANEKAKVVSKDIKEGMDNAGAKIAEAANNTKIAANEQAKVVSKEIKEGMDNAADTATSYKDALVTEMTPDPLATQVNAANEALKERKADVNYSIHKAEAQNPNAPVGDRIAAGANAAGDAIEGVAHKGAKEFYKNIWSTTKLLL